MRPYTERLVPPPSWWIGALLFGVVWGWLALVVSGPAVAVVVALVVVLATVGALWAYGASVVVVVDQHGVQAGRARLAHEHVGEVEVLGDAAMRSWHGPRADARAWLVHRAYVRTGVRIVVKDPADPTPYWLVSSRRAAELQAALETHRVRTEPVEQGDIDGQA